MQATRPENYPGSVFPRRKRVGPPRLDEYERLMHRFFEPLILLQALGQTRGPHTPPLIGATSITETRRRFLENLAFVCDYQKGGKTTTAIAVEPRGNRCVYWYGLNEDIRNKVGPFLKDVLFKLQILAAGGSEGREESETQFVELCIGFANERIKKEKSSLTRAIRECISHTAEDDGLREYLLSTQSIMVDNKDLCNHLYCTRHSDPVKMLGSRARGDSEQTLPTREMEVFGKTRHMIGRLAHHIRAPRELIEDASRLKHLVSRCFSVESVEKLASARRPPADKQTKLDNILKRMLKANDSRLKGYQEALGQLDRKFEVLDRILESYRKTNLVVHAEISVLEHFHDRGFEFADGDRFIACSKPACFCCKLYIRHHPAQCVEPRSHEKVYSTWSPPNIPQGTKDPGFIPQRNIINHMVDAIRAEALSQIERMADPYKWHPDSLTGITASMNRMRLEGETQSSVVGTVFDSDVDDPSYDLSSDDEGTRSSSLSYSDLFRSPSSTNSSTPGTSQTSTPTNRQRDDRSPVVNTKWDRSDSDSDSDGGGRL